MLALLAAVTMAAAPGPAPAQASAQPTALGRTFFQGMSAGELAARRHCKDAARYHIGYEPALLFREQDKDAARPRKLKDLPPGAMCLVDERAPGGSR